MKIQLALVWLFVWLGVWVIPATLSLAVVAGLVTLVNLAGPFQWFVWLLLIPTFYVCWLISFLSLCAFSIGRKGTRHPKPRYASIPPKGLGLMHKDGKKLMIVGLCSIRRGITASLPLVGLLQPTSWGQKLVMRSYSPSVHIGSGVQIIGVVVDPDLIEIGDYAIIGGGAAISGHVWTVLPNGKRVYMSAPVKIGARVVVGGGTLVLCGCSIGDDSVIEPNSHLEPHTQIPAGEIWGGSPAVFRAKRPRFQKGGTIASSIG